MMYSLFFGLEEIPYTIRFSRKSRRVRLMVDGARVEVVSPPTRRIERLTRFAEENKAWIFRQVMKQRSPIEASEFLPRQFGTGSTLYYMGQPWTIQLKEIVTGYVGIIPKRKVFTIEVPARFKDEARDMAIQRALRREAIKRLTKLSDRLARTWAKELEKSIRAIKIKRMKSRWGSCSRDGLIVLNEKLIHCPPSVIRYVIWHEVCHLVHFDHSKKFWELVTYKMPRYKEIKAWLKSHQAGLI